MLVTQAWARRSELAEPDFAKDVVHGILLLVVIAVAIFYARRQAKRRHKRGS